MEQNPGHPKQDFGFVHYVDDSNAIKDIEKKEKYVLEGKNKNKKKRGQLFLEIMPRSSYFWLVKYVNICKIFLISRSGAVGIFSKTFEW